MIALLSPAKLMKIDASNSNIGGTEPLFLKQACHIMDNMTEMAIPELENRLKTNYQLACNALNNAYNFRNGPFAPASYAFNGMSYKQFDARDFTKDDIEFAQKYLKIGSGAYGLLRPMDRISMYRLDLETIMPIDGVDIQLQKYWSKQVTNLLIQEMGVDDGVLLNIASGETINTVNSKAFPKSFRIVNLRFLRHTNSGLRTVPSTHLKQCRGSLARFIVKNRCKNVDEIESFTGMGMHYDALLSDSNDKVFVYEKI